MNLIISTSEQIISATVVCRSRSCILQVRIRAVVLCVFFRIFLSESTAIVNSMAVTVYSDLSIQVVYIASVY